MKIRAAIAAFGIALVLAAVPASAVETVNVTFTVPDGGTTVGTYDGTVRVTVRGTGFSRGASLNDAFYVFPPAVHDASYYQLTFGLSPLVGLNPAQNAVNFIVGGLPAYDPTHVYRFLLNTGTAVPSVLHFGVGDGVFADNGGSFTVTVASIPEPASWALLIGGFGLTGAMLRRRREVAAA